MNTPNMPTVLPDSSAISFIMPAYNCAQTVRESVVSIMDGNLSPGDEMIVVDDGSTDDTWSVLQALQADYPVIRLIQHAFNKGGAAARNTAVEAARHPLIFCLDSDNLLETASVPPLKAHLISTGADVAAFQVLRYFKTDRTAITHEWICKAGVFTLADCLSTIHSPGAGGNYLYTRESWQRAGGYPVGCAAMDAWGFGFRQLAMGSMMTTLEGSYYFHRVGHESYWVREVKRQVPSLIALQIVLPFLDRIAPRDIEYIMTSGRYTWLDKLDERPVRLATAAQMSATSPASLSQRMVRKVRRSLTRSVQG